MTSRDPRSRSPRSPATAGREATQSLDLDVDDAGGSSLANGTHNRVPARRASARSDDSAEWIGAVLGSYRVVELLGKGGMGYVFRAEHVKLGREVALKLLRTDYASRRDAVARFFLEARTVNRARHRNIVDVTDFVELDDGTTFIIMELLTGQSLGSWARTGVDLPRALAVLVQICDGLGAAHEVGVVHRDLKPDNVIVVPTDDGAELVKLLDFGVAKLVHRDDVDVGFETAAGSVIGTPAYMSPEQAGGMDVDARSDIYSLGAIMYELFCGQPMFRGRSFGEYVRKHLGELPVAPRDTPGGATIDRELESIILRCIDKDPDQRFGDIRELRDALLGVLGGLASPSQINLRAQAPTLYAPPVVAHPSQLSGVTGGSGASASQIAAGWPSPWQPPWQASPSQIAGAQLPSASIPSLPAARGSAVADPSQISQLHGSSEISQISGLSSVQHAGYPVARHGFAARPGAPWWVWVAGGALAVAVGVGAAVWYAGRGEPPVVARPVVAPPPPPPTEPAPAHSMVELRFDSLPAGGVYGDGRSVELCRTPCTFNVDLGDGGPADRRTFLIKRVGYRDGVVTVDLGGSKHEFHVVLEQLPPPPEPAATEPVATDEPVQPEDDEPRRTIKPKAKPKAKPSKPDRPAPRPTSNSIDAADTLDPFRTK